MRWVRRLVRFVGWLLTPLLAWAASFFGASAGARIAAGMPAVRGLWVTVACGALAGFGSVVAWLWLLRASPKVRETLNVTEEGAPTQELPVAPGSEP